MAADWFNEVVPRSSHHLRLVFGPSLIDLPYSDYATALAPILALTVDAEPLRLFEWWDAEARGAKGIPQLSRRWGIELSGIARCLALGEGEPESQTVRYRYFGSDVAECLGYEGAGRDLSTIMKYEPSDAWWTWAPVFEEGRPAYLELAIGSLVGRNHVRARTLTFPVRDDNGDLTLGLCAFHFYAK